MQAGGCARPTTERSSVSQVPHRWPCPHDLAGGDCRAQRTTAPPAPGVRHAAWGIERDHQSRAELQRQMRHVRLHWSQRLAGAFANGAGRFSAEGTSFLVALPLPDRGARCVAASSQAGPNPTKLRHPRATSGFRKALGCPGRQPWCINQEFRTPKDASYEQGRPCLFMFQDVLLLAMRVAQLGYVPV